MSITSTILAGRENNELINRLSQLSEENSDNQSKVILLQTKHISLQKKVFKLKKKVKFLRLLDTQVKKSNKLNKKIIKRFNTLDAMLSTTFNAGELTWDSKMITIIIYILLAWIGWQLGAELFTIMMSDGNSILADLDII